MDTHTLLELFGYIGSAMVVISMLMSNIIKLRVINTIGSVISGIYALICGAVPLALMNICLIAINLWGLYKLLKSKKPYDLVDGKADDSLVQYFIEHNLDDIKQFFPDFDLSSLTGKRAYTVCCDGTPAGVLVGNVSDGVMDIDIDYSSPAFRDCSVGSYLYSNLSSTDIKSLKFSKKLSPKHNEYLIKMDFSEQSGTFIKNI